jgi:haloalkane dehalogenase
MGESLILEEDLFVERILPGSTVRDLSDDELDVYRAPFVAPSTRLPMLQLPRELPIGGVPADVVSDLTTAHEALRIASHPKLLFVGNPGALVDAEGAEAFRASVPNVEVVQLPTGRHYLQEDHPQEIGDAVAAFIQKHAQ